MLVLALVLAASPLAHGYFDFSVWAPLELGALSLCALVAVSRVRVRLTRAGVIAIVALAGLLALSAASTFWAEAKDAAWTDTSRLAFYCALFVLALLTVRTKRAARTVMLIIGASALAVSLWFCANALLGTAGQDFFGRRLNSPIGYVNGTAGLLVMGLWPWLAWAETTRHRLAQGLSLAAAAVIASTAVLTQSRAVIPAALAAIMLVLLAAPGRVTRTVNLALIAGAVAAAAPWTLHVYSAAGIAQRALPPSHAVLRDGALAMILAALGTAAVRILGGALVQRNRRRQTERAAVAWRRAGWIALVGVCAVLTIGVILAAPRIANEYRTFTSLRVNQTAQTRFLDASGYRYDLWRVALSEFSEHPLGGLGAGNYDARYYLLRRNPEYVIQPHSLELQMAAELGIGGVLALLLFIGTILGCGCVGRRTLAAEDRFVRVAALGTFTAWLVGTSVDWLYDIPGLTGMAMLAAALLVLPSPGSGRSTSPVRPRPRSGAWVGVLVSLGIIAVLAASVGRQYVASRYAASGTSQIERHPAAALSQLERSHELDPYSLSTFYAMAAAYSREDNYDNARAVLLAAAVQEPHNYVPPALLGDLASRRGDSRLAAAEYMRALALNPRDRGLRQLARLAATGGG